MRGIGIGAYVMLALLLALAGSLLVASNYKAKAALATNKMETANDERDAALAALDDVKNTLVTERRKNKALNTIAAQHEKDKVDAQAAADQMLADLNADRRRLRTHWEATLATNELSRAVASASFADGGAELRQRDVATLRGILGRCQAQVESLQAIAAEDRKP